MPNPTPPAATHLQTSRVDPSGIDSRHPEREATPDLLSTAVAEIASGVTGVHHLGGLAARTLDRAQRQLLGTSRTPGVTVSQAGGTTTIDLDVVTEYPHPLAAVIDDLRAQVADAAQRIVDGPVAVNVVVTDVHGPFDSDPAVLDAVDQGAARAAALRDQAAERIADVRSDASDTASAIGARARDLAEEAGKQADDMSQRAGQAADELRQQVVAAKDSAAETASSLQAGIAQAATTADAQVEELRVEAADTVRDLQDAARGADVAPESSTATTADSDASSPRAVDAAVDDAARALDAASDELERLRSEVHPEPTDAHE